MLADNLLPDPTAAGRLRRIAVRIGGSVFHPLEVPQRIEGCARQAAIIDAANRADPELMQFMDAAAADLAERLDALETGSTPAPLNEFSKDARGA